MPPISNAWIFTYIFLSLPVHLTISAAVHPIPINGTCHDTCGTISVKYPFGSGFGCGHPDFSRYVRCNAGTLEFSTGTGIYSVTEIDYSGGTLIIRDPFMSTCSSMQNSGSFSLDPEDLCAMGSRSRVCRGLYSCKGVTGIGLPQNAPPSTCCVYESPIQLTGYTLDLPKLQCSSYTSVYSFGGSEGDPMKWKFGISLQYNDSYYSNEWEEHLNQLFWPRLCVERNTGGKHSNRAQLWRTLALVAAILYLKIGNERSPGVGLESLPRLRSNEAIYSLI
ncbi:hypothetical protein OIU78_006745 [Salix suchowensis]|nr:hypothetical protein OIU78_006745 [Salix suchowensis]